MSTHNPLNEYNSYSYHHFIVVAATSAHAETISNSPEDFFQFVRGGVETPGLAVLVNPMSSNKLIVQEISWTNVMNADSGTRMHSDAINALTEGKMTLLEPLGVRFFNRLFDIYNGLGAGQGGMSAVWVIKTVFVGYRDAPNDGQPEYISNLKPMIVFPTEFLSEFTEAGGRYDIKFVDANSGAGAARVSNGTALPGGSVNLGGPTATTETVTVAAAMQNLQNYIEQNYKDNYQKVVEAQAKSPNPTMRESVPTQMQYRIRLHEMLQDSSFVMDVPRQQSVGGNGKVPWLAVSPNERLDQYIDRILKMSPQVMNLATRGDSAGVKWLPLINSTTETLDPTQNDGVSSRITFYVTMRKIMTVYDPTTNAETTKEVKTPQGTTTQVVENADTSSVAADSTTLKNEAIDSSSYLEYDYTYTGRNVDVLGYDMRMNFATGFFQDLTTPSGVVKTGQVPATNNVTSGGANQGVYGKPGGAATPNPAIDNSAAALHSTNPQAVATYQNIYKKWVQTETVSVNLKIRGNPLLTDGLVLTPADLERSLSNSSTSSGLASNWLNGPIIVKVNVRMPTEDQDAYEPFWYDGFYRVITVKTTFSSGDYTQELALLGISDNSYDPVADSTEARPRGKMPSSEDVSAFAPAAEPTGERLPIQSLHISENGVKMIKTFESFAAKKYMDNTKYAIGYGHNLTEQESATGVINLAKGGAVIINNGITMEQADELLRRDIDKICEGPIHRKVAVNLYQNEYDVLCSMVYNLGSGGILGSDSTLLRLLNQQQYSQIPAQIVRWNKWSRGGEMVVNSGLDQRRKLEAQHWGTA